MQFLKFIAVFFFLMSMDMVSRPKAGFYRGVLLLDPKKKTELPFIFEIRRNKQKTEFIFRNGDERITADEVQMKGDSIIVRLPVFDTEFRCRQTKTGLEGIWLNNYRTDNREIPFKAAFGEEERFPGKITSTPEKINGRWEVTFSPGTTDSSKAIGVFTGREGTNLLDGTFMTETGDYRYLEGIISEGSFSLSAFDGSHAYLFTGSLSGDRISGLFYSGSHHSESWVAVRNSEFRLRDAEEIVTLKEHEKPIVLSFPDTNGNIISLDDEKFRNKPVILQLMGSWCPNCMDESVYLAELYRRYNPHGLEIVALAFEKTKDSAITVDRVKRMISRLKIPYAVLITSQVGKKEASETVPFLSEVTAFPTTVFLDREHKPVKVHAGFNGPATGKAYGVFRERTENLVKSMLE